MMEKASHISVTCMCAVFAITLWTLEFRQSSAIKTYAFEEECGREISMILDGVYQGQLVLRPRPSTPKNCVVTIETWYSMPHLMFYFVNLSVSCDDGFVEVTDGGGRKITGLEDRVCGSKQSDIPRGIYQTSSQYLHVNYTSLKQVAQTNMLTVIFTAYSTDECRNDQYRCSNGRCIHEGVRCNGYNSCGDNSDCKHKLSSVTTAGIVAASLVGLCILAAIVSMVTYHLYCKKKTQSQRQPASMVSNNNGSIDPHDDAMVSYQPSSLSIISGQKPAYPRHWSYRGHQVYNNVTGLRTNVNGNLHYWQEVDSHPTGSDVMCESLSGEHVLSDSSGTHNAIQGSDTEFDESESNKTHRYRHGRPDLYEQGQSDTFKHGRPDSYEKDLSRPGSFRSSQPAENDQSNIFKKGQPDDGDVCFEDDIVVEDGSDGSSEAGKPTHPDNDIKVMGGEHVRKITLLKINNAPARENPQDPVTIENDLNKFNP